jgi:hypothetical protein
MGGGTARGWGGIFVCDRKEKNAQRAPPKMRSFDHCPPSFLFPDLSLYRDKSEPKQVHRSVPLTLSLRKIKDEDISAGTIGSVGRGSLTVSTATFHNRAAAAAGDIQSRMNQVASKPMHGKNANGSFTIVDHSKRYHRTGGDDLYRSTNHSTAAIAVVEEDALDDLESLDGMNDLEPLPFSIFSSATWEQQETYTKSVSDDFTEVTSNLSLPGESTSRSAFVSPCRDRQTYPRDFDAQNFRALQDHLPSFLDNRCSFSLEDDDEDEDGLLHNNIFLNAHKRAKTKHHHSDVNPISCSQKMVSYMTRSAETRTQILKHLGLISKELGPLLPGKESNANYFSCTQTSKNELMETFKATDGGRCFNH